jgi:hypothetical protein
MIHIDVTDSGKFRPWFRELGHVAFLLVLTIALSLFLGEFAFPKGWEAIYKGLFRFVRLALLLCLPLYLLLPIHRALGWIVRKRAGVLIQMEGRQDLSVHLLKHWLVRPFQGIGIGLFFATKLLTILEVTTGQKATASFLLHQGQFQPGRLLAATGVTIAVSLLLSTVWTLDDMRVRYHNRKDQEVKMIGKYVGTVLPIFLGFYGIIALLNEFQMRQSLIYLWQMALILYPPFTVFSVFHAHYVRKRASLLSGGLSLGKGGIRHE